MTCVFRFTTTRPAGNVAIAPLVKDLFRERDTGSKWTCAKAVRIRRRMYRYQLPVGLKAGSLKRIHSYLQLFKAFAMDMCQKQRIPFVPMSCFRDNELAELWISDIAAENKGKTRPASARRALNAKRLMMNIAPLPVGGAISKTCSAAIRMAAQTVKQSLSLHVDRVKQIQTAYASSKLWYLRQVALITAFGFLALLRFGEICSVRKLGVRLVSGTLQQMSPCRTVSEGIVIVKQHLPHCDSVRAIQVCLSSRKTSQGRAAWVTVSDNLVCSMMVTHLQFLLSVGHSGEFLFPSRQKKDGFWQPHPRNPMRSAAYVGLMRLALHRVCKIPWALCMRYTGHLLRVGGNNFVRQTPNLSEDVNRQLGDWACLSSQRGYNQLSIAEQLLITDKLSLI